MAIQLLHLVWNLPPLVYVAIALLTLWYWMTRSKLPDNIPPFPVRPYPFLGHLPLMKKGAIETFHEWRKTTGDIFSVQLGQTYCVVLNSTDVMKEALVKQGDIFSDRPDNFIRLAHGPLGILFNSGISWKEQRNVSTSILKDFGMGKNIMAPRINKEMAAYLTAVSKLKGEPTDLCLLTMALVANVTFSTLTGHRFELNDPMLLRVLGLFRHQLKYFSETSTVSTFPWVRHLPGDFFNAKRVLKTEQGLRAFCDKLIKDVREAKDRDVKENFITAYVEEMERRRKSGTDTLLDEPNLSNIVANVFAAGTETTSTTMSWAILFALRHQDVQEKVYQEILDVVGNERLASIEDKSRLPYTNAFILEVQRLANVIPFGISHMCTKTTTVAGYTIPKDATVLANLSEILSEAKLWGDPKVFRPERFLDKDNKLNVPEGFIPFSIGRRHCLGEALAKMELYLFVCGVIQRFQIQPEHPDELPTTEYTMGLTCAPKAFKARMIERI